MMALFDRLPTPLAIPFFVLSQGEEAWSRLFGVLETALLYAENLLRLQARLLEGCERNRSLGARIEVIRKISAMFDSRGVEPALKFPSSSAASEILRDLVAKRNEHAHGRSVSLARALQWKQQQELLSSLLEPLCEPLLCLVARGSSHSCEILELRGRGGMFEPRASSWELPSPDLVEGQLCVIYGREIVFPTTPFFRYRKGELGDHRVDILTKATSERFEYYEPISQTSSVMSRGE